MLLPAFDPACDGEPTEAEIQCLILSIILLDIASLAEDNHTEEFAWVRVCVRRLVV